MTQSYDQFNTVCFFPVSVSRSCFKRRDSHQVLEQNVMNHDSDSENVRNGFGMDAAAEWGCQHYTLFMVFYPTDELARFCG